jgi:hypothetical protein
MRHPACRPGAGARGVAGRLSPALADPPRFGATVPAARVAPPGARSVTRTPKTAHAAGKDLHRAMLEAFRKVFAPHVADRPVGRMRKTPAPRAPPSTVTVRTSALLVPPQGTGSERPAMTELRHSIDIDPPDDTAAAPVETFPAGKIPASPHRCGRVAPAVGRWPRPGTARPASTAPTLAAIGAGTGGTAVRGYCSRQRQRVVSRPMNLAESHRTVTLPKEPRRNDGSTGRTTVGSGPASGPPLVPRLRRPPTQHPRPQ